MFLSIIDAITACPISPATGATYEPTTGITATITTDVAGGAGEDVEDRTECKYLDPRGSRL